MSLSASGDYNVVRRVIELAAADPGRPDLAHIAAQVGLTTSNLGALIERWSGLAPIAFAQAITRDHARNLLASSTNVLNAGAERDAGTGLANSFRVTRNIIANNSKTRGAGLDISHGFHASPFGDALVMATDGGIVGLAFCDGADAYATALTDMMHRWPKARFAERPGMTAPLSGQIFRPRTTENDPPVPLVLIGTDFDVKVWQALLRIPMGHAVTYADIATYLGQPTAARAVGTAGGRNPISFIVPCHRAMRGDGNLAGYYWGLTRKRAMLAWETGRTIAHRTPRLEA